MAAASIALCRDQNLPGRVFSINTPGGLLHHRARRPAAGRAGREGRHACARGMITMAESLETIKKEAEARMAKSVETLKNDLGKIRTGRAHPGLLEGVRVDYYGNQTPLNQAANVSAAGARTLT